MSPLLDSPGGPVWPVWRSQVVAVGEGLFSYCQSRPNCFVMLFLYLYFFCMCVCAHAHAHMSAMWLRGPLGPEEGIQSHRAGVQAVGSHWRKSWHPTLVGCLCWNWRCVPPCPASFLLWCDEGWGLSQTSQGSHQEIERVIWVSLADMLGLSSPEVYGRCWLKYPEHPGMPIMAEIHTPYSFLEKLLSLFNGFTAVSMSQSRPWRLGTPPFIAISMEDRNKLI